jgi:hypothetical protein
VREILQPLNVKGGVFLDFKSHKKNRTRDNALTTRGYREVPAQLVPTMR